MRTNKLGFIFCTVVALLLLAPERGLPQGAATAPATAPATATAPAAPPAPVFKPEELDQLLAPIALYPDDLLAQVLMASTYPLEIVQADRWVKDPKNKDLKGDALAAALQNQTWDPSVKSLVPFPSVLDMMSQQLDWTQKLGDAMLAQQKDVMESVQRLRQKAEAADQLKSNEQQTVTTQPPAESGGSQTIIIQPTNPQVVYVPTYNPTVVYGGWPYPAYPPYYYPPSPVYYPGQAFFTGMAFAAGVAVVGGLWGCCNTNWGGNNVNVNVNNWNNINRNNIRNGRATTLPANGNNWRHNPSHRGGVAYRDAGTRQQYLGNRGNPSVNSRDFRGYGNQAGNGLGTGNRSGAGSNLGNNRGGAGGSNLGNNRGGSNLGGNNRGGSNLGGGNRATQLPSQNRGGNLQGNRGGSSAGNRGNNAFGDFGNRGSSVNRQANRGLQSRSGSRGGGGRQFNRGGGGRR
jgi:hypothetical protein